jgi:lipoprotein-anchoring transpeptidase ErfK/SrfK
VGGVIMAKLKNKFKKINFKKTVIGITASLCILAVLYFGISSYFKNRFYFGSTINCISASGKTVKEVDDEISSNIETYVLELKERRNQREQIRASDIALKYDSKGQVQNIKDKQNPFKWISAIFSSNDFKLEETITYDENLLNKYIDNLSCLNNNNNNITEPQNASLKYTDNGYVIVDEINGNKINKSILHDNIVKAILDGEKTIDLDAVNCYENPKYTSKSQEVIDAKNTLNKYVDSKITYNFGSRKEILDGTTINNWLKVDDNFEVSFDEEKIKSYVATLSKTYNTVGRTREFATSLGTTIKVSDGDYGWLINSSKERQALIDAIKEGQVVAKEPIYTQAASSRDGSDIGKTYVEIDLTKQHLWFYKDGSLVIDGDVVTGNVSNNNATPAGVYALKYKQKDATLKGADYNTPVTFWMPFNGNIGIHDAYWRDVFGGDIYLTSGSHGCVNAPYDLAKTIFGSIDAGTPVVCYFE